MQIKILKQILILIAIVIALFIIVFIFPWIIMWIGFATLPEPPKPEIPYGEFPFKLTYELDGEIKEISDVAICEFNGYGELTTAGQDREWKAYLKSGNDKSLTKEERKNGEDTVWITLLNTRETDVTDGVGNKILELYFFGGNAYYYMGDDLGNEGRDAQDFNRVRYLYQKPDGTILKGGLNADDAYKQFKIRLISWEISDPIQNSFEE